MQGGGQGRGRMQGGRGREQGSDGLPRWIPLAPQAAASSRASSLLHHISLTAQDPFPAPQAAMSFRASSLLYRLEGEVGLEAAMKYVEAHHGDVWQVLFC